VLQIHKALDQIGAVVITLLKIIRQASHAHAQRLRCQVMAIHAGPDQKTTHPDHPVQVGLALFPIPPDPLIPGLKLQGRSRKAKTTQPAMRGVDQIA